MMMNEFQAHSDNRLTVDMYNLGGRTQVRSFTDDWAILDDKIIQSV